MAQRASKFNWNDSKLAASFKLDFRPQAVLEDFVKLMKPFEEAFLCFQEAKVPTANLVIPVYYKLRMGLKVSKTGNVLSALFDVTHICFEGACCCQQG